MKIIACGCRKIGRPLQNVPRVNYRAGMKTICSLLCALGLLAAQTCFGQSAQEIFTEAQRAYMAGDFATAKEKLNIVLQLQPNHQFARNYLRMIAAQEGKSGGA